MHRQIHVSKIWLEMTLTKDSSGSDELRPHAVKLQAPALFPALDFVPVLDDLLKSFLSFDLLPSFPSPEALRYLVVYALSHTTREWSPHRYFSTDWLPLIASAYGLLPHPSFWQKIHRPARAADERSHLGHLYWRSTMLLWVQLRSRYCNYLRSLFVFAIVFFLIRRRRSSNMLVRLDEIYIGKSALIHWLTVVLGFWSVGPADNSVCICSLCPCLLVK